LLSYLSNTQIFGLAGARMASFHAAKRRRSRSSARSESLLTLTQRRGIRAASLVLRRSPATISAGPGSRAGRRSTQLSFAVTQRLVELAPRRAAAPERFSAYDAR